MDIPVNIQVFRCYPFVLELLEHRGFNIDAYPPLSIEQIQASSDPSPPVSSPACASSSACVSPVPPIIVPAREKDALPFGPTSREAAELRTHAESGLWSAAFVKRYPVLAAVVAAGDAGQKTDANANANTGTGTGAGASELDTLSNGMQTLTVDDTWAAERDALINLYAKMARPTAEVHFHQCFTPEQLWGANSRDQKFMNEMAAMIGSMEATVESIVSDACHASSVLANALARVEGVSAADVQRPTVDAEFNPHEVLREELTLVFKRARTVLFLYRSRTKASVTLDQKYEGYCTELMAKHKVFVQLFNLRTLMFNVTKHEAVPAHVPLDVWADSDTIERIKRTYNMRSLAKENPVIPLNDPVAKFIGLRRGQLCELTRSNTTSGTYVTYRYCK